MTIPVPSGGRLLIPYKKWSGDPREENNLNQIERWALYVHNCLAPPTPTPTNSISRINYFATLPVLVANTVTPVNWGSLTPNAVLGTNITPSTTNLNIGTACLITWVFRISQDFTSPGDWIKVHFNDTLTSLNVVQQRDVDTTGVPGIKTELYGGGGYVIPASDQIQMDLSSSTTPTPTINFTLTTVSL